MDSAPLNCAVGWAKKNWKKTTTTKESESFEFLGGRCFAILTMVFVDFNATVSVLVI